MVRYRTAQLLTVVKALCLVGAHDAPMTHTMSAMQHHHAMVHLERLENMLSDLLRLISEQRGGVRTRARKRQGSNALSFHACGPFNWVD